MVILVGSGYSDDPEEPPLVILDRRSQARSQAAVIYNTVSDKQQVPRSTPHGETVVLSEELDDADPRRKCLISLNWPAAAWVLYHK